MKILTHISRLIVGVLFIFSGLIKLNDPVGFSFKLQEYFESNVLDLPFLIPFALSLAVFIVIFEVILGVLLLLGFQRKFTLWSLLLMIVFFTFLTFYSAYFNKVTDCGCFGDALPLTPWESFFKDLILLLFILILFFNKRYIQPLFQPKAALSILGVSLLFCIWMAFQVLNHLPFKDFRAYKVGTYIPADMVVPFGATPSEYEMVFIYKIDGVDTEISYDDVMAGNIPDGAEFVDRRDKLVKQGYVPPIHDFTMERDGEDFTEAFMNEPKLMIYVTYNLDIASAKGLEKLEGFHQKSAAQGYKVIAMTASDEETIQKFKEKYGFTFDFYFCDATTLKTIERANPSIVILSNGTIIGKFHHNDIDKISL